MHGEMKTSVYTVASTVAANITHIYVLSFGMNGSVSFHEDTRFLLLSFYRSLSLPPPHSIIPDMQRRTTRNEFFRSRSIDFINEGEDDFRVADRVMDSFVKASRKKYVSSYVNYNRLDLCVS